MAGTVGAAAAATRAGGLRLSAGIGGSWTSDPDGRLRRDVTPDPDAPALCDQHCQRDHIATADAKAPQVPYQPALAAFALVQALLPPVHAQLYRDVPVCVSIRLPCSASVAC